ncbi:MAG: dihydrodipicolinate reductase, partial [Candidatus Paceibacteria bacterium]
MLRVLVIGSRGKLGAHAVQCINASAEYELVPGPGRGEVTEERLRD